MMGKKDANTLTACFCAHTHTRTHKQHALAFAHTHMLLHLRTHICRHRFGTHRETAGNVARTQYAHSMITRACYVLTRSKTHTNAHMRGICAQICTCAKRHTCKSTYTLISAGSLKHYCKPAEKHIPRTQAQTTSLHS